MAGKTKKDMSLEKRRRKNFYIYTAPWLLGFFVLTAYPIIYSFWLMFTDTTLSGKGTFIGLKNWRYAFFEDPLFIKVFINTMKYVVLFVPSSLLIAFFIALLLSRKIKGLGFFRTVFYIPYITSGVATVILMGWIFNKDFGLINYGLSLINIKPVNWLGDASMAMITIVIMSLWIIGNNIIIMLAGIQDIPATYYESAAIDGATELKCVFSITLPLCTPTIYFNLIVSMIAAFQVFQQPFILTNGGPLNSTQTVAMHLFNNAFKYGKMGYASMIAWGLFILVMALTLLIQKSSKRWVFYDS